MFERRCSANSIYCPSWDCSSAGRISPLPGLQRPSCTPWCAISSCSCSSRCAPAGGAMQQRTHAVQHRHERARRGWNHPHCVLRPAVDEHNGNGSRGAAYTGTCGAACNCMSHSLPHVHNKCQLLCNPHLCCQCVLQGSCPAAGTAAACRQPRCTAQRVPRTYAAGRGCTAHWQSTWGHPHGMLQCQATPAGMSQANSKKQISTYAAGHGCTLAKYMGASTRHAAMPGNTCRDEPGKQQEMNQHVCSW
jgi:hypothetical protein